MPFITGLNRISDRQAKACRTLFRSESDSRFGFLTSQRIVINTYNRGRTGADQKPELLLGGKVTFAYGAFTRFDGETPDASLTPPAKP